MNIKKRQGGEIFIKDAIARTKGREVFRSRDILTIIGSVSNDAKTVRTLRELDSLGRAAIVDLERGRSVRRYGMRDLGALALYVMNVPIMRREVSGAERDQVVFPDMDIVVSVEECIDGEVQRRLIEMCGVCDCLKFVIAVRSWDELRILVEKGGEFLQSNRGIVRMIRVEEEVGYDDLMRGLREIEKEINPKEGKWYRGLEIEFSLKLRNLQEFLRCEFSYYRVREVRFTDHAPGQLDFNTGEDFERKLKEIKGLRLLNMGSVRLEAGVSIKIPRCVEEVVLGDVHGKLTFESESVCRSLMVGYVGMTTGGHGSNGKIKDPNIVIPKGVKLVDLCTIYGRVVFEEGSECRQVRVSSIWEGGRLEVSGEEVTINVTGHWNVRGLIEFKDGCVIGKVCVGKVCDTGRLRIASSVEVFEVDGRLECFVSFDVGSRCRAVKFSEYASRWKARIPASVVRLEVGKLSGDGLLVEKNSVMKNLLVDNYMLVEFDRDLSWSEKLHIKWLIDALDGVGKDNGGLIFLP